MDEKLLIARVDDTLRLCERTGAPRFFGFLSEAEAAIAAKRIKGFRGNAYFFGGYEGALRTILCAAPDGFDRPPFPIAPVTFSYRRQDSLSHRDFLGSMTAAGIAREKIGDILVEKGRAVAFLEVNAARFILSDTDKVGRVGVEVKSGFEPPLPELSELKEFSDTVASLRLDCVVAAVCGISRKDAAELIEKDLVSVNSFVSNKITLKVNAGDTLSVRKKGRFVVRSVDGVSKKGRTVLVYGKYI